MNRTTTIIIITILLVVLLGLGTYAVLQVSKEKDTKTGANNNNNNNSGANTPNNTTSTNSNTSTNTSATNAEIQKHVEDFKRVTGIPSGNRCNVLDRINKLSMVDLARFKNLHIILYSKTPTSVLNGLWYDGCLLSDPISEIIAKLKII